MRKGAFVFPLDESPTPSVTVPPQPGCPAGDPGVGLLRRDCYSTARLTIQSGITLNGSNPFSPAPAVEAKVPPAQLCQQIVR